MAVSMKSASARARSHITGPAGPTVLAVVVTHRGRPWLKDCLVSLAGQGYANLDVLVVDDASPDYRDAPHLKRLVKRHVRRRRWGFMRTPRSFGFGGVINWALSRVRTDADMLLFMHDDAALEPRAVELMVASLIADDATAIVGPKIVAWGDPGRLEEVGMAIDRFGYPYKGLEPAEMDLGQHDHPSEVFYVTSTCMLMRHDVFRRLRGWDAQMRAFSEDLDLCWRARVAGHAVRIQPEAKARHAIALATGKRASRYRPTRYFIRRNRLRAIAKNASSPRLLLLVPLFVVLAIAEMVGFLLLRQPREALNVARALGWNLLRLPQTLSARVRAQRLRAIPDRALGRLTVAETTRVRSYLSHEAERLEEAWGRRAALLAARGSEARALGNRARGLPGLLTALLILCLLVGFRGFLWTPPVSVGELLPFPDSAAALWRAFASPWQGAGLGQPGPASPALVVLGVWPVVALGSAGVAQKLLVAALGAVAFAGAYRLVSEVVDRPGRWVSGGLYMLGAVGYAGMRQGALGALVFGAVAPFAIHSLLRLAGWVRPAGFDAPTEGARLAMAAALGASMVPGSLLLLLYVAVLVCLARALVARAWPVRGALLSLGGLAAGWGLLLPWSATWFSSAGVLHRLTVSEWRTFAGAFESHGTVSVLLGQTPEGPALLGLALPLLGLIAAFVADGQRRRLAVVLWLLVAAGGILIDFISFGWLRPPVASPIEAGVLPAVAFAALGGIAVGAVRLDLARRGLGLLQPLALAGVALAALLAVAGIGEAVLRGGWSPGSAGELVGSDEVDEVRTVLRTEAGHEDQFRALWVGAGWGAEVPTAARPSGDHVVTGPRGPGLADLFEGGGGRARELLDRALRAIATGGTDRGGRLLGAFNIRFIALERAPGVARWLDQRDLGIVRSEAGFILLENFSVLGRAGLYTELPAYVGVGDAGGALPSEGGIERREAAQETAARYSAPQASGPGVVWLSESSAPGWTATIGDRRLPRADGGWGNAWRAPRSAAGELVIDYPRGPGDIVWLALSALGWLVVLAAAGSGRAPGLGAPRGAAR